VRDPELRRARERYDQKEVEIVTVKLEPCACDEDPFLGKLQRLAPQFRSVAETPLRSVAWEEVRKELLLVVEKVRKRRQEQSRLNERRGALSRVACTIDVEVPRRLSNAAARGGALWPAGVPARAPQAGPGLCVGSPASDGGAVGAAGIPPLVRGGAVTAVRRQ
jgi:hypothetical protein